MQRNFLFLAALLVVAFACFWPVGSLGFIGYDDYDYVYQNPVVRSGLNYDSIAWSFNAAHAGNWHPITWMSHMLDCEIFGLNPQEEHWVNLGLHAVNTLLLFVWLNQLTGARWRSFLVAALFTVHPLHVQSVAWISERKDVLSGFFFMAVLLSYTRYCRQENTRNFFLVVVLLALGLMAKPMLVTTPLVLLLLDFWPLARVRGTAPAPATVRGWVVLWRPLLAEKIPLFLLCMASCLITLWSQDSGGAMESMQTFSLQYRVVNAVVAYGLYLWKIIYPANLAIFYPLPFNGPPGLAIVGSLLLSIALFCAGIWRRQAQPYLLAGWLWFFIMLLPVIGLVQVGLQSMADRYVYLPSIGLMIAMVWGMAEIAARSIFWRAGMAGLGAVILLGCGLDTRHQLGFWRNNITLFQHVVDVSPKDDYMGYFYLGISYGELGQLESAARNLTSALEAYPNFAMARSRLGNVLLVQKKYAAAQPYLESEARIHPDSFAARLALGMDWAGQQHYAAAQSEYLAALQLNPNSPAANHFYAANIPKAQAELALTALETQLTNNPTAEIHAQIAMAQSILGRYPDAVQQYKLALAEKPDFPEWLNNLAWILATCPDDAARNGPEAVRLAQHACEVTQYKKTVFLGTLAAACAEAGQFDDAVLNARKACDNASAQGEAELLQSNQKLLESYQNHQPYHETAAAPDIGGN